MKNVGKLELNYTAMIARYHDQHFKAIYVHQPKSSNILSVDWIGKGFDHILYRLNNQRGKGYLQELIKVPIRKYWKLSSINEQVGIKYYKYCKAIVQLLNTLRSFINSWILSIEFKSIMMVSE